MAIMATWFSTLEEAGEPREWAVGFLPAGLVLFASLPALAYVVYPPEVKVSPGTARG
jgi:di/tricarboxylate transporter